MQENKRELCEVLARLRQVYGDNRKLFRGRHHARYHDPEVPYHVISRLFQGMSLLPADPQINEIVNGVIGRAQKLWPDVELFAHAFMTNHFHAMLRGPAKDIPAFVGYIKREITNRCGPIIKWSGDTMWGRRYLSTALPTPGSQENCLKYILSQGVKEGLVQSPEQWPGVHCSRQIIANERIIGQWVDRTRYSKARYKERQKPSQSQRWISERDFAQPYEVELSTIPAWTDLSIEEREARLESILQQIISEGEQRRRGRDARGVEASTVKSCRPLPQRCLKTHRKLICWSEPNDVETLRYKIRYWSFQIAYRQASTAYLLGDHGVAFPRDACRPPAFAAPESGCWTTVGTPVALASA